jgi:hypothetical protein
VTSGRVIAEPADHDGGQVRAEPVGERGGMGTDADDDVSQVCEHGHGPWAVLPSGQSGSVGPAPAWGHTRRHICDTSRTRGNECGQALIRPAR